MTRTRMLLLIILCTLLRLVAYSKSVLGYMGVLAPPTQNVKF